MAEILSGGKVAAAIYKKLAGRLEGLETRSVFPTLCILRVGQREDDLAYERSVEKRCADKGIRLVKRAFPGDIPQEAFLGAIREVNLDGTIHGVLIFHPLPAHLSMDAVRKTLLPRKDVDGITGGSLLGVFTDTQEGFPPCTAQACMEILDHYGIPCEGKRAVVIGRSLVVGKPVAMLLLHRNATVTLCHSRTENLPEIAKNGELLIAAAGAEGMVGKDFLSPGQTVVDVGIHVSPEGGLTGDVRFSQAEPIVGALTPVPGGVGAVTTAVLLSHVVTAAERSLPCHGSSQER